MRTTSIDLETTMTSNLNDEGRRVQLVVTLLDGSVRFYPVTEEGWKIDTSSRCLLIGKGFGRVYVPLDNVESFSPQTYQEKR